MTDEWQPGDRAPAPPALGPLQAFTNTVNLELGTEELGGARETEAWLRAHGLLTGADRLDAAGVARLRAARAALRRLVTPAEELDAEAEAALDAEVRLGPSGPRGAPADEVVARLLLAMAAARADGTWERLKVCRRDSCQWVFYDRSRNRSGHWCSSRVCGMRTNVERYRRRRAKGG